MLPVKDASTHSNRLSDRVETHHSASRSVWHLFVNKSGVTWWLNCGSRQSSRMHISETGISESIRLLMGGQGVPLGPGLRLCCRVFPFKAADVNQHIVLTEPAPLPDGLSARLAIRAIVAIVTMPWELSCLVAVLTKRETQCTLRGNGPREEWIADPLSPPEWEVALLDEP